MSESPWEAELVAVRRDESAQSLGAATGVLLAPLPGLGLDDCGYHQLNVNYVQVGAYHDADHNIDVNRSDDLTIPCSSD
ncbi:hypothetical protein [Streptomyces sp. NPDC051994]|uniref:hypothetical protein n=1 Tax=unclassified Streptomyces TaxID=2593676 RepID=UPI0034465618